LLKLKYSFHFFYYRRQAIEPQVHTLPHSVLQDACSFPQDVFLKSSFEDTVAGVRQVHGNFQCHFGYSDSYGKRKLNEYSAVDVAFRYLTSYVVEHGIKLVDLFARFDVDGSMSVTYDEFKEGLRVSIERGETLVILNKLTPLNLALALN
jgi:hypothetical protein